MTQFVFVGVCINPPGRDRADADKRGEYVLLECKGNPKGHEVQHLVYPEQGQPYYATWYTITEDLPARITQLLIRGGHGTPKTEGARQTVYTGRDHWRFNNKGESLRVVDKHGKVVAELTVPADRCDVLPPVPPIHGVIPPVVRPSLPAAAAFGEVH